MRIRHSVGYVIILWLYRFVFDSASVKMSEYISCLYFDLSHGPNNNFYSGVLIYRNRFKNIFRRIKTKRLIIIIINIFSVWKIFNFDLRRVFAVLYYNTNFHILFSRLLDLRHRVYQNEMWERTRIFLVSDDNIII